MKIVVDTMTVTADQEVLKLNNVGNVTIITAAEFARLLGWSVE